MSGIKLISDGSTDVTILSNVFIDKYMKDANDAQLKVYLYLTRMLQAHCTVSISDIADRFNHTEKDVLRALRYWEKCRVLSLEYGADKALTGIRLTDLNRTGTDADTADRSEGIAPSVTIMTHQSTAVPGLLAASAASAYAACQKADGAAGVSSCAQLPAAAEHISYEKPAYTLDELKAFQQKDNTAQLLFIAEQYLGRTLSPSDMKSILFFTDRLHFSDDLIDYLLQYCVERGKKDFRYMEKVAISWAEAGVTTPADAENHSSRYDRSVYTIMNALGKTNTPTRNEVAFIRRWTEEYCFEQDVILEACGRTVLATDRHRFAYADRILAAWHKAGVHHVSDIAGLDSSYQKEKSSRPSHSSSAAEYNRFMHSSYDVAALEEELLKN